MRRSIVSCALIALLLSTPALAQEPKKKGERASPWVVTAITCVVGGLVVLLRNHRIRQEEANAPSARREDPAEVDPTVIALRAQLGRGEWREAQAKLEAAQGADRAFLVGALSPAATAIDAWVEAAPTSAVARLVRADVLLTAAQQARGAARASEVGEESMAAFRTLSSRADEELVRAAELDPKDATPHALRLMTAIGMDADEREQEARFRAAIERDPLHLTAHVQRLTLLAWKWGGSHEAMFAFARETSAKAPEGSPLHALVPLAHIERWLAATRLDDPVDEDNPELADEYFLDAAVKEELLAAHARSIGSRAWKEQRGHFARNTFAFALWLGEEVERSGAELEAIGARWTLYPWAYAGEPAKVVARARVAAGLPPSA
jgi:hypothetical protein